MRRWFNAGMKNVIACHALRFFAAAQVGPVVILQGAWILLAAGTWTHAYGADSGVGEAMRTLMRGYGWLGGMDGQGRGDGNSLLSVWGKLSMVFYLIDAALQALRRPRPAQRRRPVWWWAGLSGMVTLFGMGVALWPTPDSLLSLTFVLVLFSALSAGAAAWAVVIRRLVERWTTPDVEAPPANPSRQPAA